MIVVDVNIVAFFLIAGERTAAVQVLHRLDAQWVVPHLWAVEFQSVLWKYARLRGITLAQTLETWERAHALFGPQVQEPPAGLVLREAIQSGITVYDAHYIALAKTLGVSLVTEDGELQAKYPGVALALDEFLSSAGGRAQFHEARGTYGGKRRKP